MNEVKTCRVCGESKLLSDYYTKYNSCKSCIIKATTIYRANNVPLHERNIVSRLKNLCTKARLRTKEFDLIHSDLLDVWDKQNGRCAYTKLPLLATANRFNTVSLDRVDSGKGYVVGNIQLVCAAINKMKQEYSEDLFILLSLLVTQNNKLSDLPDVLLARYFPLGTSET